MKTIGWTGDASRVRADSMERGLRRVSGLTMATVCFRGWQHGPQAQGRLAAHERS